MSRMESRSDPGFSQTDEIATPRWCKSCESQCLGLGTGHDGKWPLSEGTNPSFRGRAHSHRADGLPLYGTMLRPAAAPKSASVGSAAAATPT